MIYFIGDIHGQFKGLVHWVKQRKITDSKIVQVGDFGLGFIHKVKEINDLQHLNKFLKITGNTLYAIRGNHDNPAYFDGKVSYSNLIFLKDYSVLDIEDKTILLAGGAISIDRTTRREGKDYWKEEVFVFDAEKLAGVLAEARKVDIVVTHNAPSEFWPYDLGKVVRTYAIRDINLIAELAKERDLHSKLLKYVSTKFSPSHWYYGHFHFTNQGEYSGIKYFALGEQEIREHLS